MRYFAHHEPLEYITSSHYSWQKGTLHYGEPRRTDFIRQRKTKEMKGVSDIIDAALIFLNSKYRNSRYPYLRGVKSDRDMMEEMLRV